MGQVKLNGLGKTHDMKAPPISEPWKHAYTNLPTQTDSQKAK